MKTEIEIEVQTATQCSFIPFTAVPDGWKGKRVRIVLIEASKPLEQSNDDVPWDCD